MEEPPPKKQKEQPNVPQLRRQYLDKVKGLHLGGDRRYLQKMWNDLITDRAEGWSFAETMAFIQDQETAGDAKVSVLLSYHLSTNNVPWRHWFFLDFWDVARDFKYSPDNDKEIPFSWMKGMGKNYVDNKIPSQHHEDDAIFWKVRWRVYYMWMTMFERRCMKYFADFTLGASTLRHQRATRESVEIDTVAKKVTFTLDGSERNVAWLFGTVYKEHNPNAGRNFDWAAWDKKYGFVYKAWCAWNLFQAHAPDKRISDYQKMCGKAVINQQPRVGKHQYEVRAKRYEYNFPPEAVEAFMRSYVFTMVIRGTLTTHRTIHNAKPELYVGPFMLYEVYPDVCKEQQGGAPTMNLLDASKKLGYAIALVTDGKTHIHWPLLEQLPLCPRRIDKADPERRAIQFLGSHAK